MDPIAGDEFDLPIPADLAALRDGGTSFLTNAFRRCGTLGPDNSVTRITELRECGGGSTGRKALLSVEYTQPAGHLPTEMFVKFSRDLDDPARDIGRFQMEFEVRLALLSRGSRFPIAVPACLFADYHRESGTGILVTERISFGLNGIEPQYAKCLDYLMPDQLAHYRAIVTALGRLAGTDKGGRLADATQQFRVDMAKLSVGERIPRTPAQLQRRVARFADLTVSNPEILPANIRSAEFIARMADQVGLLAEHESIIWRHLEDNSDFIALCHWNANVDNAWFWRSGSGVECGLLDWGCVGQMNAAMAIWGALCSAETAVWDNHLDELLALFAAEFHTSGGPELDIRAFKQQVLLYAAIMGIAWLLDVPAYLQAHVPPHVPGRTDSRIAGNETVRSRLLMMTNFLNLWETADFGRVLDELLRLGSAGA
ncbi:hypothetical protein BH09ACT8_BH09ACT8_35450 [soil metagenome]